MFHCFLLEISGELGHFHPLVINLKSSSDNFFFPWGLHMAGPQVTSGAKPSFSKKHP